MQPQESRYDRGLAKMREMFGTGIDSALKSLAATSPDLVRCLVEFPFGDIYTRPGLDLKTKSWRLSCKWQSTPVSPPHSKPSRRRRVFSARSNRPPRLQVGVTKTVSGLPSVPPQIGYKP
jgi:hypothetical protein